MSHKEKGYSDYLPVHQLLNATREVLADERYLRILHNAWGITMLMRILGTTYVRPSDGVSLSLRPMLELHITKDMGHIPTLQECVEGIAIAPWMYRKAYPLSRLQDQSKVSA